MSKDVIQETLRSHLHQLCDTIGNRLIGTPGNLEAAEYITQTLKAAGYQMQSQAFTCPAWHTPSHHLAVGNQELSGLVNTFSPPCNIQAPFLVAETLDALASQDFSQHICVLSGELSKEPVLPLSSPVYLPDEHRKLTELLIKKAPPAIVAISHTPHYTLPLLEDAALAVSSITVSAEEGLVLLENRSSLISLNIQSTLKEGHSSNIIAQHETRTPHRIIVCAHYDTKSYTVGAFDNASGVAVLLTLAQLLQAEELTTSLEFIAFSGEEYGLGGDTYLESYGLSVIPFGAPYEHQASALDEAIAVINIDGVGASLGVDAIATMAMSDEASRLVSQVALDKHAFPLTSPWPASNHYDFYTHNVPSIAINSMGVPNLIHHQRDDLKWLDVNKLEKTTHLVISLIENLQDKTPLWSREVELPTAP